VAGFLGTLTQRQADKIVGNRGCRRPFICDSHSIKEAFMLRATHLAVIAALAVATAACGDRPVDRALTGGAIGAGGGALVGAAAGNPVAGAVVGGLGGAAIGAATAPER
jgi:osmotically inducible lipoprotein OsmB